MTIQRVALAQQLEDEIELWSGRLRAARAVDMDVVAVDAGPQQGVDLMIEIGSADLLYRLRLPGMASI